MTKKSICGGLGLMPRVKTQKKFEKTCGAPFRKKKTAAIYHWRQYR
jgi:hypothetical protein